jgi:hypothetical protein
MVKKTAVIIKSSKDTRPEGKRPNVSRWAKKAQRKNRTKLERVNAQFSAFMKNKNVVLVVPNINKHETNKPFVRINAKDVWSQNKYIVKQNS